jgi:hypothetical protein
MKYICVILFSLVLSAPALAATAQPTHEHVSLDGDWDFTYTGTSTAAIPTLPAASAYDAKIQVPGRWDDQLDRFKQAKWWPRAVFQNSLGPVQYLSGIGWHRKAIRIPKAWSGRSAVLTVGNAVGTTHVWLNGKHLGMNQLGVYTPYEVDLTHELKPGADNELVIAVDNAAPNIFGGWTFIGNAGMASGLARSVTLDVSAGAGRIADAYVRPGEDLKEVAWEAELMLPSAQSIAASKIEWLVTDPKSGRELDRGRLSVPTFSSTRKVAGKSRIETIQPWSDHSPNLYTIQLRWLAADNTLIDSREQRFGLRRWSHEGRKLFLNGRPFYLRLEMGAHYFPLDGAVSMSKAYWLTHMKRLKELGLNGINFAAIVCPVEMMEAADELGVILQCGDQVTRDEGNQKYTKEVWESIARTTRKYPSMSIYGFGGELQYYEGVIEQYKAQKDIIQRLNPESMVMPQQAIHGIDYGIEDVRAPGVKTKPFLYNAERLKRYTQACDLFGHYSGGAFSHNYFSTLWREMEKRFKVYEKPVIAHELFLSASYLSPTNAAKYTGRIPPYIYTRLEKDLKNAGLTDKWPVYYDHTSRLQHICRKYCMEKARKCDEMAGFELLGMMDQHFITPEYAVGMVDEFLSDKPGDTAEGIRRYNDDNVLLLDFDGGKSINRCYWSGDKFQAEIMASLYGPKPLGHGTLTWRLMRDDQAILEKSEQLSSIRHGHVSTLQKLTFDWPSVQETTRVKLVVTLKGDDVTLTNDWDFWVFPKRPAPQVAAVADPKWASVLSKRYPGVGRTSSGTGEKLRIVSKCSTGDIEFMNGGGDVVLLGTAPFTAYTMWPYFTPAKGYRPFSNGGTIIAKHPIFVGHPNEGWNDWLFYPLMDGANCVLFDGAIDAAFDPIMEIISSAGHVRKQALAFEERVGKGRLLVATFTFDMKNPSCVTMMDSILRYAQSDEFQPKTSIAADELLRAASPPADTANKLADPGFEKAGYWVNEGGKFEIDSSNAHTGRKSLKLTISDKDLQGNRNFTSGVSIRQIVFRDKPRRLKLAAWFKTDVNDKKFAPRIHADIRYDDSYIRGDSFAIALIGPAGDWRHVEKLFDLDGKITTVRVYIESAGAAGTVWVDDVYFGEAPDDSSTKGAEQAISRQQSNGGAEWRNEKLTREFRSPVLYQIDNGEWARGSVLTVDSEGVHALNVKQADSGSPSKQTVRIDLTPPTVTLRLEPLPEQEAGIFTVKGNLRCTIKADDVLSGVEEIEVSTDGTRFKTYTAPFTLGPGKYVIRCRATDRAGNKSSAMTGEWITGSSSDKLEIKVLPEGNN